MSDEKFIAMKIRELRKNAGLDVDTVGAGVGRSGKTVSAWETGRNIPSAEMLISICRFFGVSISCFYPPDVTDDNIGIVSRDEEELLSLFRSMNKVQKDVLLTTARNFAVANEKNGEGDTRDVARAGRAVR